MLVAGSALAAALVAAGAGPAHAHAALLASDPAEGGRLDLVTGRVRLVFSEDVQWVAVTATDARGAPFHAGAPQVDGATVTQPIRPGAASGPATLRWEVTSPDGHRVRGELHLVVSDAGGAAVPAAPVPAADTTVAGAEGASPRRSAVVGGVLVGLGAALFAAWVPGGPGPPSLRRRLARGWVLVAAFAAALALTGGGHAATAAVPWLARVAVAMHVVAMAAWFGGLVAVVVTLLALRRRFAARERDLLRRFGGYAASAVGFGLTAGVVTAVLTAPEPAALWRGTWGLLLLAKVAVVGVALALAARNRRSLRLPGPAPGLRGRIAVETGVLALAVGLSGWLSQADPAAGSRDFVTAVRMGPRVATVTCDDVGSSRPRVSVALHNADGSPARTVPRLAVLLTAPDGVRHRAEPAPDGAARWTVSLPAGARGRWTMALGYEVSVVDRSEVTLVVPLGA